MDNDGANMGLTLRIERRETIKRSGNWATETASSPATS